MLHSTRLRYAYPGAAPLHFPEVHLAQGELLLLSGPSGCGKSTWLALVAALLRPDAGTLTVADQPLQALRGRTADAWRARAIGFLPQRLHLSPALSVAHNLALASWAAGQAEDRQHIAATLQALGVAELAERMPAQLSGGQAQRVALARAVLMRPRVILADEPTASLDDAAATAALGLLLHTAAQHGASLVIATHDARVAAQLPRRPDGQPGYHTLQLAPAATGAIA